MKMRIRVQARSRPHLNVVQMPRRSNRDVEFALSSVGEHASSGDVEAIAVVGIMRGGDMLRAYALGGHTFALLGALQTVSQLILDEVKQQ
jgi:hypothetical protein